ncbi:MAG: hypothetical protein KC416_04550, partial [Myxococcales bacterium]|nr:hypothetical protein [Myxococcales bacterium]
MRTFLRKGLVLPLLLATAGCGGASHVQVSPLDALRARAADGDPLALRDLGLAELFADGGEAMRAAGPLAKAAEFLPEDPWVAFGRATEFELHGDRHRAIDSYGRVLHLFRKGPADPERRALAEAALYGLAEYVESDPDAVRRALSPLSPGDEAIGLRLRRNL